MSDGPWSQYQAPSEQPAPVEGPWSQYQTAPRLPSGTDAPSMSDVALNAIPKGIANLLNTPVTLWNLAKMASVAQHPAIKEFATPTPNYPMEAATKMGLVDPSTEPQTAAQRIVDTAIQSAVATALAPATGVMGVAKNVATGLMSGGAARMTKEATGSDLLALVVGVATPAMIHGVRTVPSKLTPTGKETLKAAQAEGFVVQPSTVRPTATTNKIESVAGKAALAQEASLRNQVIADKLSARAIGLPEDAPLTMDTLKAVRERAAAPYREIAELSPRAAQALEKLKQARFDAKEQWQYYMRSGNPEAGKLARKLDAQANLYERVIDREAKTIVEQFAMKAHAVPAPSPQTAPSSAPSLTTQALTPTAGSVPGAPRPMRPQGPSGPSIIDLEKIGETTAGPVDLLNRLKAARTLIARTYDVEKAINLGDGHASLAVYGRLLDQGKPLTGELNLMGRFAQAFPRVAREAASVPPPSVSGTDAASSALLGALGYGAAGGPAGLIAAGLPLLRTPARHLALSSLLQRRLLAEPYPLTRTATQGGLVGASLMDSLVEPTERR